ncbi:hypothetical protein ACKAV7_000064 [Fusarium commune]
MSSKLGFGGDGSDTRKENIFGDIRCVIDGPFSKLRPSYYGISARAIHSAIGGDMNPATSPNNPIFFLHHTQVDRLWWQWQQANIKTRLRDYSGLTRSLDGQTSKAALTDTLLMDKLGKNITVSDAMSTTGGPFCYTY